VFLFFKNKWLIGAFGDFSPSFIDRGIIFLADSDIAGVRGLRTVVFADSVCGIAVVTCRQIC
jgi:hypothetical protein